MDQIIMITYWRVCPTRYQRECRVTIVRTGFGILTISSGSNSGTIPNFSAASKLACKVVAWSFGSRELKSIASG